MADTDKRSDRKPADERFDRKTVALLSFAHFAHDTYPAFLGVLLPLLIPKLDISLAVAGILASGIRWTSFLQPLLGYLADRMDTRYWVIITPTATAVLMSLAGTAPGEAMLLVLLLMTGISHSAFHPSAGAMATRAAGQRWGKAMAWFMTGGELGRTVGPVYIAAVIALVGLERSWIAFAPGLLASILLYLRLDRGPTVRIPPPGRIRQVLREGRVPVAVLSLVTFVRALANVGFLVFYPTFATGAGVSLLTAGAGLTLYEAGGALGAFIGGTISDRLGRRWTMAIGVALAVPALAGSVLLGPTLVGIGLLAIGGFALLSGQSVELATMQEMFPDNRSSAVGMTNFIRSGAAIVGLVAIGGLADIIGLRETLLIATACGLIALPVLALLRQVQQVGVRP
ncbi:MAG: MFS transporter [Propionibacteriales bacterium]|nr:MFS transporter [Propionibacteriales bacterium]